MQMWRNWFRRAVRSEEGAATIPFVIFVPFFMTLVISSVELGMLMLRDVMLQRGLDMAVRDLRLGTWSNPTHATLKTRICANAAILPNCEANLLVELRPVSKVTWEPLNSGAVCVDRSQELQPVTEFTAGVSNDMMLIRACIKFNPIFPTTGLGLSMPKDGAGQYALVAATAFVNEPRLGS